MRPPSLPLKRNLKVLICPDKFKGTLDSRAAARAMALGVQEHFAPEAVELYLRPLADGGEGSLNVLSELRPELLREESLLHDPAGRLRPVAWLCKQDQFFLESALVIGLELPGVREIPLLDRSTAGIGEWIVALPEQARVSIFLGGSGTSDGGFGIARAIGFRFLDRKGQEVTHLRGLPAAVRVLAPTSGPRDQRYVFYSDVQSPLLGPRGAAHLYGPQKGADASEVRLLESCIAHQATLLCECVGEDRHSAVPGLGAAGGLALPLLYLRGSQSSFESGIGCFLEMAELPQLLAGPPDLVLTGEGRTDRGSAEGKLIAGVYEAWRKSGPGESRFLVVSGQLQDRSVVQDALPLARLFDTIDLVGPPGDWPIAGPEAEDRLRRATRAALHRSAPDREPGVSTDP